MDVFDVYLYINVIYQNQDEYIEFKNPLNNFQIYQWL